MWKESELGMMMARRGGLGKLRAFGGLMSSIIHRSAANFSTKLASASCSSSSPPLACAPVADALITDDLLLDAAKVESEPALLRPRVVVYDGVCHLCHQGIHILWVFLSYSFFVGWFKV